MSIRLPANRQPEAESVSDRLQIDKATWARAVIEAFIDQYNEHDGKLVWPPKFQFYEEDPATQFKPYKIRPRNDLRAAEDNPTK